MGLLCTQLDMRFLLLGPDNTFGRNREATPESVNALGAQHGFEVRHHKHELYGVCADCQKPAKKRR